MCQVLESEKCVWPLWKSAHETRQMLPQTRFRSVRKIQNHNGHTIKCLLSDSTSSPGSSPTNLSLRRDGQERTLVTNKSEVGPDGKMFGSWSGQCFPVRPSNSVIQYGLIHPSIVDPTMTMPPHPAAHAHELISRKYPQLAQAKGSTVSLYKCWLQAYPCFHFTLKHMKS